mgnify:CR=1 FL=1
MTPLKPARSALLLALAAALLVAAPAATETAYLHILHTNDIHGGILPSSATFINPDFPPMMGGGAHMATYVEQVRSHCDSVGEHVLLIDAGDIYQGTPIGNYETGTYVVEWMNAIGYDMMTLGNHDFDDGADNALRLCRMADFPVVCCNFVEEATGEIPEPVLPYVMYDLEGVRIAFIGIDTPDTYGLVDASLMEGYLLRNSREAVEEWISRAREDGADAIILVSHLGQPYTPQRYLDRVYEAWDAGEEYTKEFAYNNAELTALVPGIDVIVSGHIHVGFRQPWVSPDNHTVVVQGYANGTGIGHIRLAYDTDTGAFLGYDLPRGEEYISLFHDEFWPQPEIAAMLEDMQETAEEGMDDVIGEAAEEIPRGPAEHPLGRMIADAMLWKTGADVALMNRGGIRAAIPRGPITPRIVYQAIPFEEDLYMLDVTGAELRVILEVGMQGRRRDMEIGGLTADRNQASPEGEKMENVLVGGEPLHPDSSYRFVTTGYLSQGNVGYDIMLEHEARYLGVTLMKAVTEYIAANSPLTPDRQIRIRWIDEPR